MLTLNTKGAHLVTSGFCHRLVVEKQNTEKHLSVLFILLIDLFIMTTPFFWFRFENRAPPGFTFVSQSDFFQAFGYKQLA